jgi:hypothetical protein
VRVGRFPKHFWAPNYIVKYDGKTNPSVWLVVYHLACMVGGRIATYFSFSSSQSTWLDHLPTDSINCWEDLKEIFTGNF